MLGRRGLAIALIFEATLETRRAPPVCSVLGSAELQPSLPLYLVRAG